MKHSEKVYSIDEIKAIINPILKKENVIKAVLFVSYAKRSADRVTDGDGEILS